MVEPLRHRQTKGAATDMFYLMPPRHISTKLRSSDAVAESPFDPAQRTLTGLPAMIVRRVFAFKPNPQLNCACSAYTENPFASGWRRGSYLKGFPIAPEQAMKTYRVGEVCMKRVAIYIRVSTSKQDTDNQRRELEAVADRSGWKV
jgi:hypothetical protein